MRRFYYVDIANADEPEIKKELEKVSYSRSLGHYEPSARFLTGVKQAQGKRKKKGLIFEYEETYYYDVPVPMVCELRKNDKNQEYFVELLSQATYLKGDNYFEKPSQNIILLPTKEASSYAVVALLESLTPEEIKRYRTRILELKNAMFLGYQNYVRRIDSYNRNQRENEEFIETFIKKYGK